MARVPACCPILRLCSFYKLSKENRLPICTMHHPGQSGFPQESHLISSSLHVINLLAQCYCSAGHSSSFRERGIDQAKTASVVHLHVVSQQETIKKKFPRYTLCVFLFSIMCIMYIHEMRMFEYDKEAKTAG